MFYNIFNKSGIEINRAGREQSGQALLELAIFGSLILLLLGVLVSYGLNFDFQQQAKMEAFRTTQELAQLRDNTGQPYGSAQYMIIKERHIPDPANPFGVGQVVPIVAQASVTRDPRIDETADDYDGLPKLYMRFVSNVNGENQEEIYNVTTAGIRREQVNLPNTEDRFESMQQKYSMTYGSVSGWPRTVYPDESICLNASCSPMRYEDYEDDDMAGSPVTIEIIDSVEGEIVDYDSAIRQARMIVDEDYFLFQCKKMLEIDSDLDCDDIWDSCTLAYPWYVQGASHIGSNWHFPAIENLFILPGSGSLDRRNTLTMGLQPGYEQESTTDFSLEKEEDNIGITTTDNAAWSTVTQRVILYNDHLIKNTGAASGTAEPRVNLETIDVETERSDTTTFTWTTPWQGE